MTGQGELKIGFFIPGTKSFSITKSDSVNFP
jgi:hypothetical protein